MQLLMQMTHFKALSLTSMVVGKIHDEGCNILKKSTQGEYKDGHRHTLKTHDITPCTCCSN